MATTRGSAVRPMYGGQIVRERLGMDEPTIDCRCGQPGAYELQLQALNQRADWSSAWRAVTCAKHLSETFEVQVYGLLVFERIVVMPL